MALGEYGKMILKINVRLDDHIRSRQGQPKKTNIHYPNFANIFVLIL